MTDSELMRLLLSIDGHNEKVARIIQRIEESGRKNCVEISGALLEQCWQPASAVEICSNRWLVKKDKKV